MNKPLLSIALTGLLVTGSVAVPAALAQANRQYSQPNQYSQPSNRQFNVGVSRIAPGTVISVAADSQQGALYLDPGRKQAGTLVVTDDVYDSNGNIAIPAGSEVRGTFNPIQGGLKFVADSAVVNGKFYSVRASTKVIRDQKDPRESGGGAIAGDAAIGAAGGALIGALTGGISAGSVLGGAAAGAIVGNVTAPQVVVIDPNADLDLRVESPLFLR
ncbi:MAG: hypothetical protein H7Y22_02755 [Gemmatimonadaceae bacterium]|nr:hypothetical protein [Gloeobacterales cyanobacterium ES-bin-141]